MYTDVVCVGCFDYVIGCCLGFGLVVFVGLSFRCVIICRLLLL